MNTILIIRPFAGHSSKLMDRTVATLSQHFDVVMPEIPHETYAQYLVELKKLIVKYDNIMGVCQGGTGAVMALRLEDGIELKNKRIALLGAPIDPDAAPSKVSDYIRAVGIDTIVFMTKNRIKNMISGDMLTIGFMSLNPMAHYKKYLEYVKTRSAKIKSFYDMYFDTENMTEDFFRGALNAAFFTSPKDIPLDSSNSVFVIEGSKDEITAAGQTIAVFNMLPNVVIKKSMLVDSGHYGIFSGSKFDKEVVPELVEFFK